MTRAEYFGDAEPNMTDDLNADLEKRNAELTKIAVDMSNGLGALLNDLGRGHVPPALYIVVGKIFVANAKARLKELV